MGTTGHTKMYTKSDQKDIWIASSPTTNDGPPPFTRLLWCGIRGSLAHGVEPGEG